MIYYVLKILCGEHSKSERAESAPPALDRVNIEVIYRVFEITLFLFLKSWSRLVACLISYFNPI